MIFVSPVRTALCSLLLFFVAQGSGSAQQGTREAMADAMSRMMEAMGLFDSTSSGRGSGGASTDLWSMSGPPGVAGWGSPARAPWGSPARDPSRAFPMRELMRQFAGQMARPGDSRGDRPFAWKPSRLEGVWEGRDDELLIVQGNRFRIYSPGLRRVDGLIEVRDDRLALYNPLDENAQPFEFAESQGRLVMRDLAGQVYLYRRLRLDGGTGRMTVQAPNR